MKMWSGDILVEDTTLSRNSSNLGCWVPRYSSAKRWSLTFCQSITCYTYVRVFSSVYCNRLTYGPFGAAVDALMVPLYWCSSPSTTTVTISFGLTWCMSELSAALCRCFASAGCFAFHSRYVVQQLQSTVMVTIMQYVHCRQFLGSFSELLCSSYTSMVVGMYDGILTMINTLALYCVCKMNYTITSLISGTLLNILYVLQHANV